MQALAECQQQLDAYSASVISIEASLDDEAAGKTSEATEADASGTLLRLAPLRASLAQLNGSVEKLQAVKIDAVQVSDLSSGMNDARAKRKALNREAFNLAERISAAHARLEQLAAASTIPPSSSSSPAPRTAAAADAPSAAADPGNSAGSNAKVDRGADDGVDRSGSEAGESKADRRKRVAELIRAKREQRESSVDADVGAAPAPRPAVASMSHALKL